MAEKNDGGNFSLPNTGAIAIVLSMIAYLLVGQGAFIDERPKAQNGFDSDRGYAQDIDARLWQDPFAVVKQDIEKTSSIVAKLELSKKDSSHFEINLAGSPAPEELVEHAPKQPYRNWDPLPAKNNVVITVLAAMVAGGPYAETQEMRIRRRYALVSALSTLGYKAADPEHLGYFIPEDPPGNANLKAYELPDAIPFEWFDPQGPAANCQSKNPKCGNILVLWVDNTHFDTKPVEKIREILRQSSQVRGNKPTFHYAVIGPNDSGQLKALSKEILESDNKYNSSEPKLTGIRFFPANATADDASILQDIESTWQDIESTWQDIKDKLACTTNDPDVSCALSRKKA